MTTATADERFEARVRELEIALAEQARLVADLQARLDRTDANGGDWTVTHKLQQHPHLYQTAVPTDTAGDGSLRIVRTGGLSYIYGRAAGAWSSVQIT